ncbi:MAG: ParA family protein [Desulfobulbaceae bacterium]|nr:ParA family protein [Desulfobulbaceae bacterium]
MNRKIAVLSQKGGVGKTTVILNLAHALCRIGGKKVLVIDADPLGGIASAVNLKPDNGLVQVLRGECGLKDVLVPLKGKNLFLIANGVREPEDIGFLEAQAMAGELHSVLAVFGEYDFVLYDSPAGIGAITREILAICNSFIQVIDCRAGSVRSMAKLLNLSSWIKRQVNPGLYLEGVLVNRFRPNDPVQSKILERVRSRFPARLFFETVVDEEPVFEYAAIKGVPVERFVEGKKATKAFLAIAVEVCGKKRQSPEDVNSLAEAALIDGATELGQLFGEGGAEPQVKAPVKSDQVSAILRDLCVNGGCRGAVIADEMGLPLAEHQSPFGVDALATYASMLGETLVNAGNILMVPEANNLVMDINEEEKMVMRRFSIMGSFYFLLVVCPQERAILGEVGYAADRIAAELF